MNCPNCTSEISSNNINIQADIARCSNCNHIFKVSESLEIDNHDGFDIHIAPHGAWIKREYNKLIIGATTRSPVAFFLVPFMLVWSGGSIGGIYGSQIIDGKFDPFMSLFGVPFLIGSVIFWSIALMAIWGKVELSLDRNGGEVFTGLGNVGFKKNFTWDEISTVIEKQSNLNYPGSQGTIIHLEGKKQISFGSGIKSDRRYYLFRTLKIIISKVKANKSFV